jgi:heme A synthase
MVSVMALGASAVAMSGAANAAEQWPLAFGDYLEVTGVDVKDGGGLQYAQFLAGEWKDTRARASRICTS